MRRWNLSYIDKPPDTDTFHCFGTLVSKQLKHRNIRQVIKSVAGLNKQFNTYNSLQPQKWQKYGSYNFRETATLGRFSVTLQV